jgi:hypothetical protein
MSQRIINVGFGPFVTVRFTVGSDTEADIEFGREVPIATVSTVMSAAAKPHHNTRGNWRQTSIGLIRGLAHERQIHKSQIHYRDHSKHDERQKSGSYRLAV